MAAACSKRQAQEVPLVVAACYPLRQMTARATCSTVHTQLAVGELQVVVGYLAD